MLIIMIYYYRKERLNKMKLKLKNKKNRVYYKSIHKLNKYNLITNDINYTNTIDIMYLINTNQYFLCISTANKFKINYLKSLKQVKQKIHLYLSGK